MSVSLFVNGCKYSTFSLESASLAQDGAADPHLMVAAGTLGTMFVQKSNLRFSATMKKAGHNVLNFLNNRVMI